MWIYPCVTNLNGNSILPIGFRQLPYKIEQFNIKSVRWGANYTLYYFDWKSTEILLPFNLSMGHVRFFVMKSDLMICEWRVGCMHIIFSTFRLLYWIRLDLHETCTSSDHFYIYLRICSGQSFRASCTDVPLVVFRLHHDVTQYIALHTAIDWRWWLATLM